MKTQIARFLQKLGGYIVRPNLPKQMEIPDMRTAPAAKAAMVTQFGELQKAAISGSTLPKLQDCGFRVFSQFEEDGLLLYLAAVLEIEHKIFVDIGSSSGINSNCANLALNLGWHGLFIDGDENAIQHGKEFYSKHPDTELYPPIFQSAFITAENINQLVGDSGFNGPVGVVSIDIDGNDYWVWKALETISPSIVVIETHSEFGLDNIVVPYNPEYFYPGKHPQYHGASPVAMVNLGKRKGYRLVGANRFGFNLFFVRNDVFPERVPEVQVESILRHQRYFERLKLADPIKEWEYLNP
jgi:hypothetical protein